MRGAAACAHGCMLQRALPVGSGIVPEEVVEPMPDVLVALAQRLVRWGVLPPHKTPDSAIINIYDVVSYHHRHHLYTILCLAEPGSCAVTLHSGAARFRDMAGSVLLWRLCCFAEGRCMQALRHCRSLSSLIWMSDGHACPCSGMRLSSCCVRALVFLASAPLAAALTPLPMQDQSSSASQLR